MGMIRGAILILVGSVVLMGNGAARGMAQRGGGEKRAVGRTRSGNASTTQPAQNSPRIAYEDLVLLVRYARRALRTKIRGMPERAARFHPPSLLGRKGIIHVTLRKHGAVLAESESSEMEVVDASVAAGTLLGRMVLEKKLHLEDDGDRLGLEFEWLGDREDLTMRPFRQKGVWSDELLHAFEPAVEGIGVAFRGRRGWTRPSEIITLGYTPDLALISAERMANVRHVHKLRLEKEIRYFRFWGYLLWQPDSAALPVVLVRGDTLVQPLSAGSGESPRDVLDAAIGRMGRYLQYRQNRDGAFSPEYLPSGDRYHEINSATIQLRALNGLAEYSIWLDGVGGEKTSKARDAVSRSIDYFSNFLRMLMLRVENSQGKAVEKPAGLALMPPGHSGVLELSSRMLSAMMLMDQQASTDRQHVTTTSASSRQEGRRYSRQRLNLTQGLLSSQDKTGRIAMVFGKGGNAKPTADQNPSRDAEGAWALLALAQRASFRPGGNEKAIEAEKKRIDRAMYRGLAFFLHRRGSDSAGLSSETAAALVRAYALYYAQSNDARFSDFVFEIVDRFVSLQLNADVCPYPELYGAINARQPGVVGADTAVYLTAMAEGLALARRVGDRQRVKHYREATRLAVRFIMQLEVRPMGCFFIRTPTDALGGVRTALWDGRIRVDHCADAVIALIHARRALFGKRQAP